MAIGRKGLGGFRDGHAWGKKSNEGKDGMK